MSAPLVKGIIITASVLVAAGIAIFENEQIRRLIDEYRRRIAIAFYSLGDGINPSDPFRSPQQHAEMAELNRQRRNEIVMRNRAELVRQARSEGIAVDLDELTALGILEQDLDHEVGVHQRTRTDSNQSFDDIVGTDGKLKSDMENQQTHEETTAAVSSIEPVPDQGLRQRGAGVRGLESGAAFANPFDDHEVLFDRDLIGPTAEEYTGADTVSHTVRSVSPRPMSDVHILDQQHGPIDIPVFQSDFSQNQQQSQYKTQDELDAEIEEAIRRSLQDTYAESPAPSYARSETVQPYDSGAQSPHSVADSLFDPASPRLAAAQPAMTQIRPRSEMPTNPWTHNAPQHSRSQSVDAFTRINATERLFEAEPSGTRTPTEDAFSTVSSVFGDAPEHITHDDTRSEAAETHDSFSVVGASTPGSWTDVDSESETEAANGQSHVMRR